MMYPAHIVTVDIIEERLARELFFLVERGNFASAMAYTFPLHFRQHILHITASIEKTRG
jgi:hypothetical protein